MGRAGGGHALRPVAAAVSELSLSRSEAVALAIAAVREKGPVRLIAGGRSKGASITPLAELTQKCVKTYTIGEMGNVLSEKATGSSECCATLETAVARALGELVPGEQLLLSPGGTSWDQFENYKIRGQVFQRQLTQTVR